MMKQRKKAPGGSRVTVLLLAAAVILLVCSALGSTRAALNYRSEIYMAQMEIDNIGVTLIENSRDISARNYKTQGSGWDESNGVLLEDMLDESDGKLKLGKDYKEELAVRNSGTIEQYVRVRIYKYWTDEFGKKDLSLSPDLIELNLPGNGWIPDENARTEERLVLYYPEILESGESTPVFVDKIRISNGVASKVREDSITDANGLTTITTTYAYDGYQFNLEAEVDAVQTHNAEDAIKSAWGVDVTVRDGRISAVGGER